MNGEQAQLFQQLLEEACDHFIDEGGKVITHSFVNLKDGGQCPLTCLFGRVNIETMTKEMVSMIDTTANYEEMWTFITAFDGGEIFDYQKKYVSMLLIAKALREKYIGVPV